ncbi:TniQ family protein [Phyllobacterium sp. 0TCS1.6C]|uniref:TniQ family protein n=1 Tax=unclassified Phyllobacterium TaxID=2638441 RepID=UPI00226444C1|nr:MULTISPECIES: TniQ family protein [unclassified Phyllobacterium]MCX8281516.1 TniQ family protein [Phyllobacterium sp. 0TCS1.6C]MCX8292888.1 TniQ family protein [Phyllobacterium sp. 0TCS1.6A]
MTRRLALTCKIADRETPTSLASRLAVRNMVNGAGEFCLDMRLNWKSLTLGDAGEISRLADLAGVPSSPLQRYAIRSIGAARHKIGREIATNRSLKRTGAEYCPVCLRESIAEAGFAGAYRRVDWQFQSIRCCEIHNTPLRALPEEKFTIHAYDFASVARKHWELIISAAGEAQYREPNELEHYIRKRLSGWRGQDWIDSLPLPAVSKASEMLGMRLLFGASAAASEMSDGDWHSCGQRGFDVLRGGPSSLLETLWHFKAEYRSPFASHNRDLGGFFAWLTSDPYGGGVEPLRKLVRSFIVENYPVVAGTSILGRRIDRPICITLGSVEKQLGIRQDRLIHMLQEFAPTLDDLPDPPSHVTLPQIDMLKQRIQDIVPVRDAGKFLGCSLHHATGFVKCRMLEKRRDAADKTYLSQAELLAFIKPIEDLPIADPSPDFLSIYEMSSRTRQSVFDIYKAFREARLLSARRDPRKFGIDALLLDPAEAQVVLQRQAVTSDPEWDAVRRFLRIDHATLGLLSQKGHLTFYRARHPASGYPRKHVRAADVERFDRLFISLGRLRQDIGQNGHGGLMARLAAGGIRPAFSGNRITRIYRRAEVERVFGTTFAAPVEDPDLSIADDPSSRRNG